MRPSRSHPPIVIILSLIGLTLLGVRLTAQVAAEKSQRLAARGGLERSLALLERAVGLQPRETEFRLALGELCQQIGGARPLAEALAMARRAREAFTAAARLSPLDFEAQYGLARTAERLAQLGAPVDGDDPLAALQRAIVLAPRNVRLRYALARHLHYHGQSADVPAAVAALAGLHPSILGRVRGEGFWSPAVRAAVQETLQERIAAQGPDAESHHALSTLQAEAGDYAAAATHYERALTLSGDSPASYHLIHLGGLLLKAGEIERAESIYLEGLENSAQRERDLAAIAGALKQAGRADRALAIFQEAERRHVLSEGAGVQLARVLVELGQLPEARVLLEKINRRRPDPEAWTWLARIAEREADWDAMEIAAQKAAMLDASRAEAHHLFAQALVRQKKWERAETEMDLVIALSPQPATGHLHQRAAIRQSRGDSEGAAADWLTAARLEPAKPHWPAQAAAALERAGDLRQALALYRQALTLDPANVGLQKALERIEGMKGGK